MQRPLPDNFEKNTEWDFLTQFQRVNPVVMLGDEKTMRVEDQYTDVLQNIEFGIVTTYKDYPGMSDSDVTRMLEALVDRYAAEKIGRPPRHFSLSDVEQALLENVRRMCEWRLGRGTPADSPEKAKEMASEPITIDEIMLCLKRVLKSVKRWNKDGGRRGYLSFVTQYVR